MGEGMTQAPAAMQGLRAASAPPLAGEPARASVTEGARYFHARRRRLQQFTPSVASRQLPRKRESGTNGEKA
jgi:hypothetical protein